MRVVAQGRPLAGGCGKCQRPTIGTAIAAVIIAISLQQDPGHGGLSARSFSATVVAASLWPRRDRRFGLLGALVASATAGCITGKAPTMRASRDGYAAACGMSGQAPAMIAAVMLMMREDAGNIGSLCALRCAVGKA